MTMPVYVDRLRVVRPSRWWRFPTACHLFADTRPELAAFAERMGLAWEWFQDREDFPHFDITEGQRCKAVRLGALEVSDLVVRDMVRRNRNEGEALNAE